MTNRLSRETRAEVEKWREAGSVDAVGNSSIVGEHGTQEYCAQSVEGTLRGYVTVSRDAEVLRAQKSVLSHSKVDSHERIGKDLAC
jgi:hypothetical protein